MPLNPQDEIRTETRPRRAGDFATLEPSDPESNPYAVLAEDMALPAIDPFAPKMDFRVDLAMFRGPLDLLLYLVRKHELDVTDIPIALVTDQYSQYLELLEQLDVDQVGDFIELASLLIEIKSRVVLPQTDEDDGQIVEDDPRQELVQRLLEYKKYKDAASMLRDSGRAWQQRYPRCAKDLPPRTVDPREQPIHEVELWDLVSAVGRIIRESERLKPLTNIVYDDTPMQIYMQQLHEQIVRDGEVYFTSMFEPGMHKSKLIGIFLAILELTRNYSVIVEQVGLHGEMVLRPGKDFKPVMEISEVFLDFNEPPEQAPAKPR